MVIVSASSHTLGLHARTVSLLLRNLCLEMELQLKFTGKSLVVTSFFCMIAGIALALFLKVFCDTLCCRKQDFEMNEEDS